jgi:hypothetical protein
MACPYFYPVARFEASPWVVPPRLPLGDAYTGECRAPGAETAPDETHVREICNVGYGRGCCDRFPDTARADAVRFHIVEDAGELIRIQYVFEKECWPGEHGVLECTAARQVASAVNDEILREQATAFLESYLRRRG